jgi:PTH1 family peptidyl-tRNA hydrolase
MKLIVGLGNPGRSYARHRHNVGFMALNRFARAQGIKFDRKKGLARIGRGKVSGNEVLLARPQTFMNDSGRSVSRLVERFEIDHNDLIVIHDDLDLPLAKVRISHARSSGGHKGINSIIQGLDTRDFIRLRIGIGRPNKAQVSEEDVINYVLNDFTPAEKRAIDSILPQVSQALLCLLKDGLTPAMNKFN